MANKESKQTNHVKNRRSVPVMHQDGSSGSDVATLLGVLRQMLEPVSVLEDETKSLNNRTDNIEETIEAMAEAIIVLQGTAGSLQKKVGDRCLHPVCKVGALC